MKINYHLEDIELGYLNLERDIVQVIVESIPYSDPAFIGFFQSEIKKRYRNKSIDQNFLGSVELILRRLGKIKVIDQFHSNKEEGDTVFVVDVIGKENKIKDYLTLIKNEIINRRNPPTATFDNSELNKSGLGGFPLTKFFPIGNKKYKRLRKLALLFEKNREFTYPKVSVEIGLTRTHKEFQYNKTHLSNKISNLKRTFNKKLARKKVWIKLKTKGKNPKILYLQ